MGHPGVNLNDAVKLADPDNQEPKMMTILRTTGVMVV